MTVLESIKTQKVVSIVRGVETVNIPALCEALYQGGVTLVEITLNSPNAYESIRAAIESVGDKMIIGAGTVIDEVSAKKAIDVGASFLLSPNLDQGMIETALSHHVVPIPGVLTPTEMVRAVKWGAPMVKIFPVGALGPSYIKDVLGPLSDLNVMAVGGIHEGNAQDYLQAGAMSLGVGSQLANPTLIKEGCYDVITQRASDLMTIARKT